MDPKAFIQKHKLTAAVAGGCLVIGSQYGSCSFAPPSLAPAVEEAAEEAPTEEAEEAPEEEKAEEADAEADKE